MTTDLRPAPKPVNLWILQSAFLVGLVLYSGVGMITLGGRAAATGSSAGAPANAIFADPAVGDMVGTVLLAFSVLIIVVAFALPRFMAGLDPDRAATADDYLDSAFKQLVITNALLEAPALVALVAILLGKPVTWALAVIALSAGGMILMIPKIRGWIGEYERRAARER
jgi:hypothetical protein